MSVVQVFGFLGSLVTVYMILCMLRIALAWFGPAAANGAAARPLVAIVDPYLAFFSRIKRLRGERIDFSPIVAITALWFVSQIFYSIGVSGKVSLSAVLAIALSGTWSVFAFLLDMFAMLILLRVVAYFARWNSLHPAWQAIDATINPIVFRIKRTVYRDRIVKYQAGLITALAVIVAFRVILGFGVNLLSNLLVKLPF
ncbi:MAG: YggT family protein [Spirochaetes bacterium]|nr:YggT family protein [Spirochaetota bacterium]